MGMEILLVVFGIGVLTKFVDLIVDEGLKLPGSLAYAGGTAYGILIAYVLVNHPLLAPLGFAIVIAVLVTKKIDSKPHVVGILAMVLSLAVWGLPAVDLGLLLLFIAAGVADEILSDPADRGRIKGILSKVLEKRVVLEIVTFLVSFATGYWIIFLGMLSYDVGYHLTGRTGKRFK